MKRNRGHELETPIASLIDVVFLLIIFFVVTASVEKDIIDDTLKLAQASYTPATKVKDKRTFTINVRKDGSINISKIFISPAQLKQILIGTRRKSGDDVPILIRCDGDAPYEHVAKLQKIIGESGFYRVKLAAWATGGGE